MIPIKKDLIRGGNPLCPGSIAELFALLPSCFQGIALSTCAHNSALEVCTHHILLVQFYFLSHVITS